MNVMESSAWLEYFADGPNAAFFAQAIEQPAQLVVGLAMLAARVSLETRLPMADSVVLATAKLHGATLWTQDEDFEGLPGVRYRATSG